MNGRRPGRRSRWAVAAALAVGLAASSCTYTSTEPGLFGRDREISETPNASSPPRSRPRLFVPVAGEAVWSLGTGSRVQVRVAVHAVRRVDGGTVLDWSLTPLSSETLPAGRAMPEGDIWGLRPEQIRLLDPRRRVAYPPLVVPATGSCVCTRSDRQTTVLRTGQTSLMQTAFANLPAGLDAVDVVIPIVPAFGGVPVAPVGTAPRGGPGSPLARPAARGVSQYTSPTFTLAPERQRFAIELDSVIVSATFSSVVWRVRAVTAGPGLDPLLLPAPETRRGRRVYVGSSAQAPPLSSRKARRRSLDPPVTLTGLRTDPGAPCWCTDPVPWAPLQRPGDDLELVATLPPVPDPTTYAVDVVFPRLTAMTDVGISPAPAATTALVDNRPYRPGFWSSETPAPSPADAEWPSPVPSPELLASATAGPPERW